MKRIIAAVGAISFTLVLGACSAGTSPSPASTTTVTTTAPATMASSAVPAGKDIVDTAVAAGDFTTLVTAVSAAGLADTLKGSGPFTVFAPTDAAFAKLPEGTVDSLLKEPQGQLAEILKYHVVAGEFKAADVVRLNGQKIKTVQGGELSVDVTGNTVRLVDAAGNSVNVIATDVDATNGVIHVIDGVLMPA